MRFAYRLIVGVLSFAAFVFVAGCSDSSAEEQFRIACNTRNLPESGKFEGRISSIHVDTSKIMPVAGKIYSSFSLDCPDGRYFSLEWIGGDLSKAESGSTAVITVKNRRVTDVLIKKDWSSITASLFAYFTMGVLIFVVFVHILHAVVFRNGR
jgi:hypothetical protein